jgi:Uncharacterized conserved protein
MAIRIGCGSWTDDAYTGVLYPAQHKKTDRLRLYAQRFDRIELNSSYYNIPSAKTTAGWVGQTPGGFLFDVKLHRDFSAAPQRAAAGPALDKLIDGVRPLHDAQKLGVFFLVLPPSFGPTRRSLAELDTLAEKLTPIASLAIELRDRAWIQGDRRAATLDYFRTHHLVWISTDVPSVDAPRIMPVLDEPTHPDFAYLRLHGRNPDYPHADKAEDAHHYDYPRAELEEIAARIRKLATRVKHVHVSANNHAEDFAPKAALTLRELLGQPTSPPPDDQLPLL